MTPPEFRNTRLRKACWVVSGVLLLVLVFASPWILAEEPVERRDVITHPFETLQTKPKLEINGVSVPLSEEFRVHTLDYRSYQLGEFALFDLGSLRLAIEGGPRTQEAEGWATVEIGAQGSVTSESTHHVESTSGIPLNIVLMNGTTQVTWGPLAFSVIDGIAGIPGSAPQAIHGPRRVAFFDHHGVFLELVDVEEWRSRSLDGTHE